MNHMILGGAGFIGSNLARTLVQSDSKVVVIDDLSNGNLEFLQDLPPRSLKFIRFDLSREIPTELTESISEFLGNNPFQLWHLAANSDIQTGIADPRIDLDRTLATTITALKIAEYFKPHAYIFASSSAIYGDANGFPFAETQNAFSPISAYGIMKLASEQIINCFKDRISDTKIRIYRFPNVIGIPLTHGVIHDFYFKLKTLPPVLNVLGDGFQRKPFLHVDDLISAMSKLNLSQSFYDIFNIGPNDDGITVREIAEAMRNEISPNSVIQYGDTPYGWKGDVPKYAFNVSKSFEFGVPSDLSSWGAIQKVLNNLKAEI